MKTEEISAIRRVFSKASLIMSDKTITIAYPHQYWVYQNCERPDLIAALIEGCQVFRIVFGLDKGVRLVFEFPEAFSGTMYCPPLEQQETPEDRRKRIDSLPVKEDRAVKIEEFFDGVDMNDDFEISQSLSDFLEKAFEVESPAVFHLDYARVWENMLKAHRNIGGISAAEVDIDYPEKDGFAYIEYSFLQEKKSSVKFSGKKKVQFAELFRVSAAVSLEVESDKNSSSIDFTFFNKK